MAISGDDWGMVSCSTHQSAKQCNKKANTQILCVLSSLLNIDVCSNISATTFFDLGNAANAHETNHGRIKHTFVKPLRTILVGGFNPSEKY
jgi:hypothetical protein